MRRASRGIAHELRFVVPVAKTVPSTRSPPGSRRCRLLATGFMVGLIEWAYIDAIAPHLDDGEMSLGIHVDLSPTRPPRPGSRWPCACAWRRSTAASSPSGGGRRPAASASAPAGACTSSSTEARFEAGVARKTTGG